MVLLLFVDDLKCTKEKFDYFFTHNMSFAEGPNHARTKSAFRYCPGAPTPGALGLSRLCSAIFEQLLVFGNSLRF